MKNLRFLNSFLVFVSLVLFFSSCSEKKSARTKITGNDLGNFYIGWASTNITPDKPVLLLGQNFARISEGVMDPITATALAIESVRGSSSEKAIMISCDLALIGDIYYKDNFQDNVRKILKVSLPELSSEQIIINATHTHTAPVVSTLSVKDIYGVDLNVMLPADYNDFLCRQIAAVAKQAWRNRKIGGISFGLGQAIVGHNRLSVDFSGKSVMYGKTNTREFSHIEGYEDHSVNLLYTWNKDRELTGVVINIACPSQVSEGLFNISADYWNDTRLEVRKRLGKHIYILPQCSAAGDQSPHLMFGAKAEERMQHIMELDSLNAGRGSIGYRKQIALRISDAVTSVFPYMKYNIDWNPSFYHRIETVNLSRRLISIKELNTALKEATGWKKKYEEMLLKIKENPQMKKDPRWYVGITESYSLMKFSQNVQDRYDLEKRQLKMPVELHVLRIGDVVIATNPFELYLDYGIRIKARSPAVQTFLVQLAGSGTYVPSSRSVAGGSYGAVPTSNLVGPEGGQELVEKTLELINSVWQKSNNF